MTTGRKFKVSGLFDRTPAAQSRSQRTNDSQARAPHPWREFHGPRVAAPRRRVKAAVLDPTKLELRPLPARSDQRTITLQIVARYWPCILKRAMEPAPCVTLKLKGPTATALV